MTDTRLKIGIDVDDVLAGFVPAHQKICREICGKPHTGTNPNDWAFSNYGMSPKEHEAVWNKIKDTVNFWETLVPLPRTSAIAYYPYDVIPFFITSRIVTKGDPIEIQTARWIKTFYDSLENPTVIVSHSKGPLVRALNLDYFIDDRDKNVLEVADAHPTCKVFIKTTSHNKDFNDPRITRVSCLNDFLAQLPLTREERSSYVGFGGRPNTSNYAAL